jgi:hypothetical protein
LRTFFPCLAVLAAAIAVGFAVHANNAPGAAHRIAIQQPDAWILEDIGTYRSHTWRYQQLMGAPRTPYAGSAESDPSLRFKLWVRDLWRSRAAKAKQRFAAGPPHKREWLCIHHYEGSWTAATGNGYYGGLQMDLAFQRTYAPKLLRKKGTADRWTPLEQMWVAEKAHRSGRGFYPWPNTARSCGLL